MDDETEAPVDGLESVDDESDLGDGAARSLRAANAFVTCEAVCGGGTYARLDVGPELFVT